MNDKNVTWFLHKFKKPFYRCYLQKMLSIRGNLLPFLTRKKCRILDSVESHFVAYFKDTIRTSIHEIRGGQKKRKKKNELRGRYIKEKLISYNTWLRTGRYFASFFPHLVGVSRIGSRASVIKNPGHEVANKKEQVRGWRLPQMSCACCASGLGARTGRGEKERSRVSPSRSRTDTGIYIHVVAEYAHLRHPARPPQRLGKARIPRAPDDLRSRPSGSPFAPTWAKRKGRDTLILRTWHKKNENIKIIMSHYVNASGIKNENSLLSPRPSSTKLCHPLRTFSSRQPRHPCTPCCKSPFPTFWIRLPSGFGSWKTRLHRMNNQSSSLSHAKIQNWLKHGKHHDLKKVLLIILQE